MAGRHDGRADERHAAHRDAADRRTQPGGHAAAAEHLLHQRDAPHDGDAAEGAQHAEGEDGDVVDRLDRRGDADVELAGAAREETADGDGADRRHDDGCQGGERVGADHQLERIERAGERRIEGGRDGAGSAAADEQAEVVAAQAEGEPGPGGKGGPDLRVAGLEPDRGAHPVRPDRLQHDDDAVAHGHPAAVERVRLDGVDRAAGPPAGQRQPREAERQPADGGHGQGAHARERHHRRQELATREVEEPLVHLLRDLGHADRDQPGHHAHPGRQHHQPDLVRTDERAQRLRRMRDELAPGPAHTPHHRGPGDGWAAAAGGRRHRAWPVRGRRAVIHATREAREQCMVALET